MKIQSVLVVHKRSEYEQYSQEERDPRFLQLLGEDHFTVQDLRKEHQEHREAVERVGSTLEHLRIPSRFVLRTDFRDTHGHDMIIALGGDGTFLDVSHHVRDTPVLGVNSTPSSSIGAFCAATARTFPELMEAILEDRIEPQNLARLSLVLNGHPILEPVLNEVLICAQTSADMARYVLEVLRKKEHQQSSGVYISTAAGSTAASRSAGGKLLPWDSSVTQFLVREPHAVAGAKFHLLKGTVPPKSGLRLHSKMKNGMIYIDGSHVRYRFDFGDELVVSADAIPLKVFGVGKSKPRPRSAKLIADRARTSAKGKSAKPKSAKSPAPVAAKAHAPGKTKAAAAPKPSSPKPKPQTRATPHARAKPKPTPRRKAPAAKSVKPKKRR